MSNEWPDSDDSDSSDGELPSILALNGLSANTLALLTEFQSAGGFFNEDDEDEGEDDHVIPKDAVCVTSTAKDSQVIADTLRRLQRVQDEQAEVHERALLDRTLLELMPTVRRDRMQETLEMDGVVRINDVLSQELCALCLQEINELCDGGLHNNDNADHNAGFGNVLSRRHRYDMYLRNEGVVDDALRQLLSRGSALGELVRSLLHGAPGVLHEWSSLISDPASASQSVHPDSPYDHAAPVWTVFVALQDVDADMGPTVFLPRTHDRTTHDRLTDATGGGDAAGLLAAAEYRRGLLRRGDCAVMDARTLHFGDANTSTTRRVLYYFSVRNPQVHQYPECGSLYPDLCHLTARDYYE